MSSTTILSGNKDNTMRTICAMVAECYLGFRRELNAEGKWVWHPPAHPDLTEEERNTVLSEPPFLLHAEAARSLIRSLVYPASETVPPCRIRILADPFGQAASKEDGKAVRYNYQIERADGRAGRGTSDNPELALFIAALDMLGLAEKIPATEQALYPKLAIVR